MTSWTHPVQHLRPAAFLDRDGVINRIFMRDGKPRSPTEVEDFEFLPGAIEGARLLKEAGFLLVVVTNQPDVARGWLKREVVDAMNELVRSRLGVDRVEVCFHDYADSCECRKPKPGMLTQAARALGVDLLASFMIGDRRGDIEAGREAGCRTILIGDAYGEAGIEPDVQAPSLLEAARIILSIVSNSRLQPPIRRSPDENRRS